MKPTVLLIIAILSSHAGAGSWTRESIAGMDVNLYTPSTAPALNTRRALMINLHGCAQSSADLRSGGNWQPSADQYGMVVAIPDAPGGGVILGCWDYYHSLHTPNNKHNDNLIQLARALTARATLNIDPDQVYLSGLSSGGGQTAVLGCLAPDIFAGLGINAGPAIGTSSFQIGSVATTVSAAKNLCLDFAGNLQTAFDTQVASVIFGTGDTLVATGYNNLNASMFASLYGANADSGSTAIPGGGTETTWSNGRGPRVSLISVAGMAHAWPAGQGSGGSNNYIDHASVNYPQALTAFLFANNRRALLNAPPVLTDVQWREDSDTIAVSGTATDTDGTVINLHVSVSATSPATVVDTFDLAINSTGFFSGNSRALEPGHYLVTVVAEDNRGAITSETAGVWVGPIPPDSAPLLVDLAVATAGACVIVSGSAVDNNLDSVSASFDSEPAIFIIPSPAGDFAFNDCDLSAGDHSVTVTATDTGGNSTSSAPLPFVIAGATATLSEHIGAGRLDYTAYATCYLTYGDAPFTLFLGADSRWSDNAGCIGPVSGGGPGGGPAACTEHTSSTASHVLAGRAQLCGLISYCALGSGDYLGLYSFFGDKTLAESPPGHFVLGNCPGQQ